MTLIKRVRYISLNIFHSEPPVYDTVIIEPRTDHLPNKHEKQPNRHRSLD